MPLRPLTLTLLTALLLAHAPAGADVIIWPPEPPRPIPGPPPTPPLRVDVESTSLDVEILDGVATTTLSQVIRNPYGRPLQAQFVLPIPRGATVHDASLRIGDTWVEAEVMPASEARRTYEDIVRRAVDPALIEYIDDGLLRTRVFPVPPQSTREIELTLTTDLPEDFGTWQYRFPLKACGGSGRFSVQGTVESSRALDRPYSPTHDIAGRLEDGGHRARFSLESPGANAVGHDLQIFLPTRGDRLTVTVVSTKPTGEDGYALLRISPGVSLEEERAAPKRIVFLLDVSGSMRGEKLAQAKAALRYCLENLDRGDRFGLVAYEASARSLTDGLRRARARDVESALDELERLDARGGTNIGAALRTALDLVGEDETGPAYLLLLTDGLPTVGTRDVDALLEAARRANRSHARIFTFGVGTDVDPRLLDGLARESKALPRYVLPGEDLEVSLGNLYAQISEPLWTDLELDLDGAGLFDQTPEALGDLFRGQSITLVTRYRDGGRFEARLRGRRDGRSRRERFDVRLATRATEHDYVPQLWAARRIGALQAELRAHGAQKELIDEIIRLGSRYGIVTEYTSLLMREGDEQLARQLRRGDRGAYDLMVPRVQEVLASTRDESKKAQMVPMAVRENRAMQSESLGDNPYDGALGGDAGRDVAPGSPAAARAQRKVGRRIFRQNDEGCWVDALAVGAKPRLSIRAFSQAYFELLDLRPDLRPLLSIGASVRITLGEDVLEIGDEGVQELDAPSRAWIESAPL